jgi:Kef-type K+ transport system membrane component KefB
MASDREGRTGVGLGWVILFLFGFQLAISILNRKLYSYFSFLEAQEEMKNSNRIAFLFFFFFRVGLDWIGLDSAKFREGGRFLRRFWI